MNSNSTFSNAIDLGQTAPRPEGSEAGSYKAGNGGKAAAGGGAADDEDKNLFQKGLEWMKENPWETAGIAGTITAMAVAFPKPRKWMMKKLGLRKKTTTQRRLSGTGKKAKSKKMKIG